MQLPSELAFLEEFFINPAEKYRKAEWLLNEFESPIWQYRFHQKKVIEINWDVQLEDGSSLLQMKNNDLLNAFRYWLIIATQPDSCSGSNHLRSQHRNFECTIVIIDYLLLHSNQYELSKTGLSAISGDEFKDLLTKISADNNVYRGLFDWNERLSKHLVNEVSKTDTNILNSVLINHPYLDNITVDQECGNSLNIDISFIPRIRAWAFLNGYYNKFKFNCSPACKEIFRNTLHIKETLKPSPEILSYEKDSSFRGREKKGSPIINNDQVKHMSKNSFNVYHSSLYKLGALNSIRSGAPSIESFRAIQSFFPETKKHGRFSTLPSSVIFESVKSAIEFHFEYGEELVSSYCRVVLAVQEEINDGITDATVVNLQKTKFNQALDPKIKDLGVKSIGLSVKALGTPATDDRKGSIIQYYERLRANEGLLELVAVYIGCVQVVVGALMARRSGELIELLAGNCLDDSEKWLIFFRGKSSKGMWGLRDEEARPIDPVAVQMIKQLERMQKILKRLGVIDEFLPIFSTPELRGFLQLRSGTRRYNANFDLFCDYFEIETDSQGRRYYIRQHLLRRFFAMLFFHSSAFGGIDTLRWMLGHTDLEHVWNYITESTTGRVLRGTTAQWSAENITALAQGDKGYKELAELIHDRFGVKDVFLLDSADLEVMIEELLEDGSVEIEPEFFEDQNGQQMLIMCKVIQREVAGNG